MRRIGEPSLYSSCLSRLYYYDQRLGVVVFTKVFLKALFRHLSEKDMKISFSSLNCLDVIHYLC